MSDLAVTISSLSMDLNRVALGLYRGSDIMAKRFYQEALNRKSEIDLSEMPLYIKQILNGLKSKGKLDKNFAEKALVYSVLLENFVVKKLKKLS